MVGTGLIGGHVICHVVTGWQGGSDAVGIVVGCLRCGMWLFCITMIWIGTMQLLLDFTFMMSCILRCPPL